MAGPRSRPADGSDDRRDDDRGQAYTLEAVGASIIVLIGLVYVFQSVVLTPTTAGTVDRDVRAQLRTQINDGLAAAHDEGGLEYAALLWDNETGTWFDDISGYQVNNRFGYGPNDPPGQLGDLLDSSFDERGYNYNVYIEYQVDGGEATERVPLIKRGRPSDTAVTGTYSVVLTDDMELSSPGEPGRRLEELNASEDEFYAPDIDDDGPLYNVAVFRVIVW
ncbi:hypothetical protein BRD17_10155 [Halobacteriales archaeon SW_7_68_16]|nr:MAG: hypothetical protein BRD17_10155 [Halobacteriales archaeon SW_7_68_16]